MYNIYDFYKQEIEVLIVEDEIVLAMALEESLKNMNFSISGIATTKEDAISYSFKRLPDIILMDINLNGEKSGVDIGKKIWQNLKIPIIFLTSYSNDKVVNKAMEAEPYAYLIKPYKDKDLKTIIKTSLHKHNYFFKTKQVLQKEKSIVNCINSFCFDKSSSRLYKKDKEIKLTKKEKMFFEILCENPNDLTPLNKIINYIYRESIYDLGRLRMLVYRLRIKLGCDLFENVYDDGYKLKTIEEKNTNLEKNV